ncbi:hypothetical protein [Bacillus toyonensis]|uniref:hypothetical protein n=1 Tax=Bacillus toyonensis TaxID=155322 RepID=UPI0011A562B4|nr:hypothetical protein [Bacillus toyonensis]
MKQWLRDLFTGVLGSLIATCVTTGVASTELGKVLGIDIVGVFSFIKYWIVFFLIIFLIRWIIRKIVDKKQASSPIIVGFSHSHDIVQFLDGNYFKWEIHANKKRPNPYTNEVTGIDVDYLEGPYCKNDARKIKESRGFWGLYKYKCPECGFKKTLLRNSWTLEKDLIDRITASFRKRAIEQQQEERE